jgi:BirA family biotin operon repressor/biotin-[acetyl-CoA-carboxylase] ligase
VPADLDARELSRAVLAPAGGFARLEVVASTGSTNTDLRSAAAWGAPDRSVLLAEKQTAGQGRRARQWVSPPGTGLYCSVLLRPEGVPAARLAGVVLLAGVALVRAVRGLAGVPATLKWPNDLLAGEPPGKCAGVLAESAGRGAVVLGIGVNVFPTPRQTPPGAGHLPPTSLVEAGWAGPDRAALAAGLLAELDALERPWRAAGGELAGALGQYRSVCRTLGREVRVELPNAEVLGRALDVDATGALLVRTRDGARRAVSAGDVVHLRERAQGGYAGRSDGAEVVR